MGSHKGNGYSSVYAHALAGALETHHQRVSYIDINDLTIHPCVDCNYCKVHFGACVFKDDMTQVYEVLKKTDKLIVVSPVYFAGVTSRLKTLIDRIQMVFMCDFHHKKSFAPLEGTVKEGMLVSFGGARLYDNQFTGSKLTLELVFRNFNMSFKSHITYSGTDHWDEGHHHVRLKSEAVDMVENWMRGDNGEE